MMSMKSYSDRTVLSKTIVVVAPRILLANQLSSEFLYHNLDGALQSNVTVNVIMFIVERLITSVQLR